MLHHHTASLQHSNVTKKKTRHFLKGWGGEAARAPHFLTPKQGKMEVNMLRGTTFVWAEGWEEGTKGQGRYGRDLW